jgi:hypothetical protein
MSIETTNYDIQATIINGKFTEESVSIPANTTYAAGTVFAQQINGSSVTWVPCDPDATNFSQVPTAVLVKQYVNSTGSAFSRNVRLLITGEVYENKLVLHDGTSTLDTVIASYGTVKNALKNNGIIAVEAQQLAE